MGPKRIPVPLVKRIVSQIAEDFPENVTDACEYTGAGGATDRCIAGQALSLLGVSDTTLGELEGIVQDIAPYLEEQEKMHLSPAATAYLRAAQAYQDGDAVAAGKAAGTDLAFIRGERQPWLEAKRFADQFYTHFIQDAE